MVPKNERTHVIDPVVLGAAVLGRCANEASKGEEQGGRRRRAGGRDRQTGYGVSWFALAPLCSF